MQWTNKGHEFDILAEGFRKGRNIYIYGAGEHGSYVYERLLFLDCVSGFIDNDERISECCGKPVVSLERFVLEDKLQSIVIIAAGINNRVFFLDQLERNGYREGRDVFHYDNFLKTYLSIYALYSKNKVVVPTVTLVITTICNLDCKDCLNFTHFNKNKKHMLLEKIIADIDSLFMCADYIDYISVSGGEPFLHSDFEQIIEYIGVNYRNKINVLGTVTNGTIVPSVSILRCLKKYDVTVWLDDYRENVELANKNFELVRKEFEKYGVKYIWNSFENWFSVKSKGTISEEKELQVHFDCCDTECVSVHDSKCYICGIADFAMRAGLTEEEESEYFKLELMDDSKKKEFLEFVLGYSKKGYCNFCRSCAGYLSINRSQVPVAEQYE